MKHIKKIKLKNFKKFETFTIDFDSEINLFIGDNEAGKSSILTAIDIALSGSRNKIETHGLDNLFNQNTIDTFLSSEKKYEDLPVLFVELYFNEQHNPDLNGKINSDNVVCDGFRFLCEPNDEWGKDIKEILSNEEPNFPYEYYTLSFKTFSGDNYSGYKKYFKHILIDSSQISNEYATKEYVKAMYNSSIVDSERFQHHNQYRKQKELFRENNLKELNARITDYAFSIRNNSKANVETDLTLTEDNINIENKGKGKQCFIKTSFALNKSNNVMDVIMLEEPENHLSHIHMKKLISKIRESTQKQLFITTHSDLISTRLDLRKAILLNSNSSKPILLKDLPEKTAKFFIKAPDNNILEFVLSKKVLLVEGDAEYILMEAFFKNITLTNLENSDVHIISVGGTGFKRYMDLARLLKIKTAIIRDNDKDFAKNCVDNYLDYTENFIKVFSDENNLRYTFEVCMHQDNESICEELFSKGRKTLTVLDYMLSNKAESAYGILDLKSNQIIAPQYIKEAIEWIRK